jgi:hypothetical protein
MGKWQHLFSTGPTGKNIEKFRDKKHWTTCDDSILRGIRVTGFDIVSVGGSCEQCEALWITMFPSPILQFPSIYISVIYTQGHEINVTMISSVSLPFCHRILDGNEAM